MRVGHQRLKVVSNRGQTLELDEAVRVAIGRSRKNEMVLRNPYVSRRHIEIWFWNQTKWAQSHTLPTVSSLPC